MNTASVTCRYRRGPRSLASVGARFTSPRQREAPEVKRIQFKARHIMIPILYRAVSCTADEVVSEMAKRRIGSGDWFNAREN